MGPVRRSDIANDVGDGAEAMHVGGRGLRHIGVALHENADLTLLANSLLRSGDRAQSPHRERQH